MTQIENFIDRSPQDVKQEILLTLVYLNQFYTFQMLGIQFEVSESTVHDIFHYEELPSLARIVMVMESDTHLFGNAK
jgi:Helix-turn-helix of DDE superfamily endonuclease